LSDMDEREIPDEDYINPAIKRTIVREFDFQL
jgi:hypothetical protein